MKMFAYYIRKKKKKPFIFPYATDSQNYLKFKTIIRKILRKITG